MTPPSLSRVPLLVGAGAMSGGVMCFYGFGLPQWMGILCVALALVGTAGLWWFWRRIPPRWIGAGWGLLVLGFFGCGMVAAQSAAWGAPPEVASVISSRVERVDTTERGLRLLVKTEGWSARHSEESGALRCRIMLYTDSLSGTSLEGCRIAFPCQLKEIDRTASPGKYLWAQGVDYFSRVNGDWILVTSESGEWLTRWLNQARHYTKRLVDTSGLHEDTASLLKAMLTADRSDLAPEVREDFRRVGLVHVLAVSGMHVVVVAMVLALALFWLDMLGLRWLRIILLALGVWAYALFAGMGAPVVRAAIMATMVGIALLSQRHTSPLNALGAAMVIILFCYPRSLYEAGFQMSFLVTAGLILFAGRGFSPSSSRAGRKIWGWVLVPVVAMVVAWPLAGYWFHGLPLLSVPANAVLTPILVPWYVAGLCHLGCAAFGLSSGLLARLTDHGAWLLTQGAHMGAEPGWSYLQIWPAGETVVCYLVALCALAWVLHGGKRWGWYVMGSAAAACVILSLYLPPALPADSLEVRPYAQGCHISSLRHGQSASTELEGNQIACCTLLGQRVALLDSEGISACKPKQKRDCDILVIGPRFRQTLGEALRHFRPKKIMVHSAAGYSRYQELRAEWEEMHLPDIRFCEY